MTLHY